MMELLAWYLFGVVTMVVVDVVYIVRHRRAEGDR